MQFCNRKAHEGLKLLLPITKNLKDEKEFTFLLRCINGIIHIKSLRTNTRKEYELN